MTPARFEIGQKHKQESEAGSKASWNTPRSDSRPTMSYPSRMALAFALTSLMTVLVLVEAALVGEVAHRLRNIPNVIGFLGGSDTPVPLRPAEVNHILGTVDELQEQQEDLDIQFYVGESVKITFGPFSGFTGIIEEVNAEKKKLKVMVKVFGRKTPLELGYMQVEKE